MFKKNDPKIHSKLINLIQLWYLHFEDKSDILPGFFEMYHNLLKKGINFPQI